MKSLFIMVCVFGLTIGASFAEGENMTNADGSFCEEGGKSPASLASSESKDKDAGAIQE